MSAIELKLSELIKIRVSQINDCVYCLKLHTGYARRLGETTQRLNCLSAWQDCDFFTEAEKLALALAEHVTLTPTKRVSDALYQRVLEHYDEKQYMELNLIIKQINRWNKIFISMRTIAIES